ncbi:argininosuccinate lyase [Acrocarpospora phusangensis]|uniref:argininosuccinate lyase n=1 Tax=Acrocarpospora phusangensis TaxID=1070424 RepID=A0A919UKQ0_9ACTN|nr:lyase family protein [Acrocarpospora phusangensis]GIH25276.1 argininosuccinate lyase [Acrocarpospora phusangensis]
MTSSLTGRLTGGPARLLQEEALAPQFAYDRRHLLTGYVRAEKALLAEYLRMGVLDADGATTLARALDAVRPEDLDADPDANLSDFAFALEGVVQAAADDVPAAWHVDRSRNDLQATAQLMFARRLLLDCAGACLAFGRTVLGAAAPLTDVPMPGYTHLQAAQVISPGFYLAALAGETLDATRRMVAAYHDIDRCPLGAGAMAGQELDWDRGRLAALLGFAAPVPHALTAVAGRGWHLALAGEWAALAVTLSRFTTDLMAWAGEAYGFLALPDELAAISSAMPQKKNYPIFERVRGRLGHVAALATDVFTGQRNTPYANSVEVGKEAGANLLAMADHLRSALRLLGAAIDAAEWRHDRMWSALGPTYIGGFALANALCLREALPWRAAQVVAGRYVRAAMERGLPPDRPDVPLLRELAAGEGHRLTDPAAALAALAPETALSRWRGLGSAHPRRVDDLLTAQGGAFDGVELDLARLRQADARARTELDGLFGIGGG